MMWLINLAVLRLQMQCIEILRLESLAAHGAYDLERVITQPRLAPIRKLLAEAEVGKIVSVERTHFGIHRYTIPTEHLVEGVCCILVDLIRMTKGAIIVGELFGTDQSW